MFPRSMPVFLRLLAAVAVVLLALAVSGFGRAPEARNLADSDHSSHAGMDGAAHEMTNEEMQRDVDAWFANHPIVGANQATGAPVVTIRAFSNKFDVDGNLTTTSIDTVVVGVGETVQWQRLIGAHTVTNGFGSIDIESGTVFDVPLDSANPIFQFTYNVGGMFPFYCRTHEGFAMVGVVEVIGAVPTRETSWGQLKAESR